VTNAAFIQQLISPSWLQKDGLAPEVRQITEGAMGVGTKFVQEASNHLVEATIAVIAYQRPMVFALEVARGRDLSRIKWVLKADAEGTMVTLVFGPKRQNWWVKVLGIVVRSSRTLPPEYAQRLRQYIEERC
jgi:hypothetical protein